MRDGLMTGTGESDTVFAFGSVLGPCYGQMVLSGGRVHGYDNPRERRYRLHGDVLEFLDEAGQVTSRLERIEAGYVGRPVDGTGQLYLTPLISIEQQRSQEHLKILINSAPKSGTYWLRKAFVTAGYRPTDLHLSGAVTVDDNRELGDDSAIHARPADRRIEVDLGLLPVVLPPGSVTVGHIEDVHVLRRMQGHGLTLVNLSRDPVATLMSMFRFKRDVVEPLPGEVWRGADSLRAQFLGFVACYADHDIAHWRNCRRAINSMPDVPHLRYEDLRRGLLPAEQRSLMIQSLGSRRAVARLENALAQTKDVPTSTWSGGPTADETQLEGLVRDLVHATAA